MTPLLMTVPEAAAYLGRSPGWVRERVRDGRIPARRDGRRFLISRVQLDRWLGADVLDVRPARLGTPRPRGARVA